MDLQGIPILKTNIKRKNVKPEKLAQTQAKIINFELKASVKNPTRIIMKRT